ncbi:hypothetical protein P5V15_009273 [Pogonomyrmex californicus]
MPEGRPLTLGTEILICQICKKRGHCADKCRLRDPQSRQPLKEFLGDSCEKHVKKSIPKHHKYTERRSGSFDRVPTVILKPLDEMFETHETGNRDAR